MATSVSSWFIDQLQLRVSKPQMFFTIGGSDYSERVDKWPKIRRTATELRADNLTVPLTNVDGELNLYYENTYNIPSSATLEIGFTHPDSATEKMTLYSGFLKNVGYTDKLCKLKLEDRLSVIDTRIVGESNAPVTVSSLNPGRLAWDLCTCYGGLSSVESTNNPDINYTEWLAWTSQFSDAAVLVSANYEGLKVREALKRLSAYTDSAIFVEGDGKITFQGFKEISSNDTVLDDEIIKLNIDVESKRLINRQVINYDYSVDSNFWASNVSDQNTTSVNTFGLQEDFIEDDSIWYVNTISALSLAQRRVNIFAEPPKRFLVDLTLTPVNLELSDTIRLVDSFFSITSATGWQITEYEINMQTGATRYEVDGAVSLPGFFLDVSCLDSNDRLL